ncbi:MAG: hypothetical protein ABFD97_07805 [Syntrophobacter sp.]
MEVIVQLRLDIAVGLQKRLPAELLPGATRELLAVATEFGVNIEPVHPGSTDPLLVPYFRLDATSRETAQSLVERFLKVEGVIGAYIKPPDELP